METKEQDSEKTKPRGSRKIRTSQAVTQDSPSEVWTSSVSNFEERYMHVLESGKALMCNLFPAEEVEIKRLSKLHVTASSLLPPDFDTLGKFVRFCFWFWSRPWVSVERPFSAFKSEPVISLSSLPSIKYELEMTASGSDALSNQRISFRGSRMSSASTIPSSVCSRLSMLYNPQWDWGRGMALMLGDRNYQRLADPNASKVFQKPESIQFCVSPGAVSLSAGACEPLFCSLALFHIGNKVKISETFRFAGNAESHQDLVRNVLGPDLQGDVLALPSCVFSVSTPSQYVYLVLTVYRVLQGDEEKTALPYLAASDKGILGKAFPNAGRKLTKIRDQMDQVCSRLGANTQLFAFSFLQVFDADGKFILTDGSFNNMFLHPPGSEFSICEAIASFSNKKTTLKQVAGSCPLSVKRVSPKESLDNRLDVSLMPYVLDATNPQHGPAKPGSYLRDVMDLTPISKPLPFMNFIGTVFVNPLSLSLPLADRKSSLVVRMEFRASDDDQVTVPLKMVFSGCGAVRRILSDVARATVMFSSKNPSWTHEEFRVLLPRVVTPKHHLMFFISEIDVSASRKDGSLTGNTENLLGVAILRLMSPTGVFIDDSAEGSSLSLPIISLEAPLPRGYLALAESEKLPLLEGGKELLKLHVRGFSSTMSSDPSLSSLIRTSEMGEYDAALSCVTALREADVNSLVPHFPSLVHLLIDFIARAPSDSAQQAFQTLITICLRVHTLDKRAKDKRTGIVHNFIDFVFEPMDIKLDEKVHMHYGLVLQFMTLALLVKKNAATITPGTIFSTSWMIFDLIAKSMILTCFRDPQFKQKDRIRLFLPDFPRILKKLLVELRGLIFANISETRGIKDNDAGPGSLNLNMAMFLTEIICVFDRGLVIDLISQHMDDFVTQINARRQSAPADSLTLTLMLFDFCKLVSDHEGFVSLNLPKLHDVTPEKAGELHNILEERHPLVTKMISIVIDELVANVHTNARALGLGFLANFVCKLDRDVRFVSQSDRGCIAVMLFSLVLKLGKSWKALEPWRKGLVGSLEGGGTSQQLLSGKDAPVSPNRIFERQDLAFSVAWVVQTAPRAWLRKWWTFSGTEVSETFFPLLEEVLECFRFQKQPIDFSTPYATTSANIEALTDTVKHGLSAALKLRTRLGTRGVMAQQITDAGVDEEATLRLKYLCHDITLLVVSLTNDLLSDFKSISMNKMSQEASPPALAASNLILRIVDMELSTAVVPIVFDLMYRWVRIQEAGLFHGLKSETSRLVFSIVRLCNSSLPEIRKEAALFLYRLIVANFEHIGTFELVKNASIIACSRLAEDHADFGGASLKSALDAVSEYALSDLYVPPAVPEEGSIDSDMDDLAQRRRYSFVRQVQDLSRALEKIVRDTREICETRGSSDVEMVADQYFRISEGYKFTPELRLEWLEKLSQFHAKNGDFAEAAVAMTHVVALLGDYLNTSTDTRVDSSIFKKINPSIAEFYSEESMAGSAAFSLRHFKFAVKAVIKFLEQAELYEMANDMYRLLLSAYHSEGSYRDLTNAHTQLEGFFSKLAQNDSGRLLGRYFRVGFFGKLFGKLDGQEFVYKEKLLTHLYALKERLVLYYTQQFGDNKVEVFEHGGAVDVSTLDPNKVYLQITALRPVWPEEEDETRKTFFQKNTLLSSFAFETPFVQGGKIGQASTADQWMRRTILTTESVFPALLKRILVRSRKEVNLSPIEIAIEAMQTRIEKLQLEVDRDPPDPKTLQQVLQGSVLTTVNRGIIEYLEIFLSNQAQFSKQHVRALQGKFRGFFSSAEAALKVNASIIDSTQAEFQSEMEQSFRELRRMAEPLLKDEDEDHDEVDTGESNSTAGSPRLASPRFSRSSRPSSPRSSGVPKRRSITGKVSGSKAASRNTSPRSSQHDIAATSPTTSEGEIPPTVVVSALKKSAHRLSVDKARRTSSSASLDVKKVKPARSSSSASLTSGFSK